MQAMLRWLDPILNPLACISPPADCVVPFEKAEQLLKRLEALLQHRLKYALSGERRSLLKGQGLDFSDLREYAPGDDIRKIDWSVFARTLMPHVREYQEEKQLTLWLSMDLTPSMNFGQRKTKLNQAIELAGLLGLMADKGGHKLGAILMGGQKSHIIPPKAGYAHLQHIIQQLLNGASKLSVVSCPVDPLPVAFKQLGHVVQKNSTVLLLSDFLSYSSAWQTPLGQLSQRANLIYMVLQDALEMQLPGALGLICLQDPETGQTIQIDTNDRLFHQAYQRASQQQMETCLSFLKKTGVSVCAPTHLPAFEILMQLVASGKPVAQ